MALKIERDPVHPAATPRYREAARRPGASSPRRVGGSAACRSSSSIMDQSPCSVNSGRAGVSLPLAERVRAEASGAGPVIELPDARHLARSLRGILGESRRRPAGAVRHRRDAEECHLV